MSAATHGHSVIEAGDQTFDLPNAEFLCQRTPICVGLAKVLLVHVSLHLCPLQSKEETVPGTLHQKVHESEPIAARLWMWYK
jgi:hypothetical protein